LHRLVMDVQAETDPLMEGGHWLFSAVHIPRLFRLDVSVFVHYMGYINQTLQCSHLGHNEFSILWTVQGQTLGDVHQRDPGVAQADHAHARLDHVVPQTDNQRVRVLRLKLGTKLGKRLVKLFQLVTLCKLEVGSQCLHHRRLSEHRSVWDFSYMFSRSEIKRLNYTYSLLESHRTVLWSFSHCLKQMLVSFRVLQLGRFDAPCGQEPSPLIVGGTLRESGFGNQLVRLLKQAVVEVVPQQQIHKGGLTFMVAVKSCCAQT
ncbi:hypothetical protein EGW08_015785, partial [Elysia chlorotica]